MWKGEYGFCCQSSRAGAQSTWSNVHAGEITLAGVVIAAATTVRTPTARCFCVGFFWLLSTELCYTYTIDRQL